MAGRAAVIRALTLEPRRSPSQARDIQRNCSSLIAHGEAECRPALAGFEHTARGVGAGDDHVPEPTVDEQLAAIARRFLGLETLETRNSDALDFHEHAVWAIEAALEAAFAAGKEQR